MWRDAWTGPDCSTPPARTDNISPPDRGRVGEYLIAVALPTCEMHMHCRPATVILLLAFAACSGLTNTPDPNVVHVANLSYVDTACGPVSCGGGARFQLLNSSNAGRQGEVLIFFYGPQASGFGVNTRPDGWGWVPFTVDRAARPYRIIACPEGVAAGDNRCASGSTG